jgi:osmotically-inducible protein OsmY
MQKYDRERDPRSFRGRDDAQRLQSQRGSYRNEDRWESRDAQRQDRDDDHLGSYAEQSQWRDSPSGYEPDDGYRSEFAQQRYGRGQDVDFGQDYDDQRGRPRGTPRGVYGAAREYGSASGGQYMTGDQRSRPLYGENSRGGWSNESIRQGYASPRSPYGQGGYGNERNYGYGPNPDYGRDTGPGYGQDRGYGFQDYDRSGQGYVGGYGSDLGYGERSRQGQRGRMSGDNYDYGQRSSHYAYGNSGAQGQSNQYGDAREDAYGRGLGESYGQSLRGRGPKNYLRSDERIREDLSERLSDDPSIDASEINVEVKNGVVTLSGSVDARHLKHRVEDLADQCSGVKDVENRLSVQRSLGNARSGTGQNVAGSSGGGSLTAGGGGSTGRSDETQKKH